MTRRATGVFPSSHELVSPPRHGKSQHEGNQNSSKSSSRNIDSEEEPISLPLEDLAALFYQPETTGAEELQQQETSTDNNPREARGDTNGFASSVRDSFLPEIARAFSSAPPQVRLNLQNFVMRPVDISEIRKDVEVMGFVYDNLIPEMKNPVLLDKSLFKELRSLVIKMEKEEMKMRRR